MKHPKPATPKAMTAALQPESERQNTTTSKSAPITSAAAWTGTPALASAITPSKQAKLPALFISHGAPTLAIEQSATTSALARIGQNLPKPRAIIIM